MGVRKQHVKSADILHVWIWYPPRAQAYSQTTAANFFVFWTRCQWPIKHTAYHLNTALTLFLFLIFKSSPSKLNINSFQLPAEKKGKFARAQMSMAAPLPPGRGRQLWPGWLLAIDTEVSDTSTCIGRKMIRSQFQSVMDWGRRSSKKLKFYFCSGSNEIIWYPLEGSIRTRTKRSKGSIPCRQVSTLGGGGGKLFWCSSIFQG